MLQIGSFRMDEDERDHDDVDSSAVNAQENEADGLFALLPDELVQCIFWKLDLESYLKLSFTCSRLRDVCTESSF